MPPLTNILLLAFLFVTIGFIAGALISMLWVERDNGRKNSARPKNKAEEEKHGRLELQARLWRDPDSGKLVAGYNDQLYTDAQKASPQQRNRMLDLAQEWVAWLGGVMEVPPETDTLVAADEPVQSRLEAASRLPESVNSDSEQAPDAVALPRQRNVGTLHLTGTGSLRKTGDTRRPLGTGPLRQTQNQSRPSATAPLKQPTETSRSNPSSEAQPPAEENQKPAQPASIVAQIDQILQDMLSQQEYGSRKSIRLTEHPEHGVTVWVGIERFEGIDAVRDNEARALIRKAVSTWEQRTERNQHQ